MEREYDICKVQVVTRSRFNALKASRKYDRRGPKILFGKEKLADGRDDIVIRADEWRRIERLYRETIDTEQQQETEVMLDAVMEQASTEIKPEPEEKPSIPDADKLGGSEDLPEHPESGRKPPWFKEPFDPWGGR